MKRLIPAAVILILTVVICIYAHIYVEKACDRTLEDVKLFCDEKITSYELEELWNKRKEKMALFVNNGLLDDTSINIARLTVISNKNENSELDTIKKDIESVLLLIKDAQKLNIQSFY